MMKLVKIAAVAVLLPCAAAALDDMPTRFEAGGYAVNLLPTRDNIMPTVTFAGRTFSFAYRTDGRFEDGDVRLGFHSAPTNAFVALKRTSGGIEATYVHSLYAGSGEGRRFVGLCSNEVVFAKGVVGVRATLYPSEPGRYRFRRRCKASQVAVFQGYAKSWVGTTLCLVASKDVSFMNELTPHGRFDPKAWGMNMNDTGVVEEMVFGNVPDVISFRGRSGAGFYCNRYKGGFEAAAVAVNEDVMHKPAWDKPFSFSYVIELEK